MKLIPIILVGLICFALGGVFGAGYRSTHLPSYVWSKTDIAFPIKVYTDTDEFVSITGRLSGEGVADKNNVETITCYKNQNACEIQSVSQIGPHQISSLYPAWSLPITHWSADVITASDFGDVNPSVCYHSTLNIDRAHKGALVVQEPANQSALNCQHADNKIYKWTIERSLWEAAALAPRP